MHHYQNEFIEFALQQNALRFGEFELKSGRKSPYFFNAGLFNDGAAMAQLGHFYAAAIAQSGLAYDVLFGPAYKGIPLVTTCAVALARDFGQNKPFAFNRKEAKAHGEGGHLVGAPLAGKVLIVDDVMTAGTAVREAIGLIQAAGAEVAGVVVALDRQEKGQGELSAVQEVAQAYAIPVISIVALEHILAYVSGTPAAAEHAAAIREYRTAYGVN